MKPPCIWPFLLAFLVLLAACQGSPSTPTPAPVEPTAQPSAAPTAVPTAIPTVATTAVATEQPLIGIPKDARVRVFKPILDTLYAGTDQGLFRYGSSGLGPWERVPGTKNTGLINTIELATNGDVLFGADAENKANADPKNNPRGGLFRIHNGTVTQEFPETVFVITVHSFDNNELQTFAGTWDKGIQVYNERDAMWEQFIPDETEDFQALRRVHSIEFSPDGMWIGTVEGGIYFINNEHRIIIPLNTSTKPALDSDKIRHIILDYLQVDNRHMVVAEDDGSIQTIQINLARAPEEMAKLIRTDKLPAPFKKPNGLAFDQHGDLWVASLDGGTYIRRGNDWLQVDGKPAYTVFIWKNLSFIGTKGHGIVVAPVDAQR